MRVAALRQGIAPERAQRAATGNLPALDAFRLSEEDFGCEPPMIAVGSQWNRNGIGRGSERDRIGHGADELRTARRPRGDAVPAAAHSPGAHRPLAPSCPAGMRC